MILEIGGTVFLQLKRPVYAFQSGALRIGLAGSYTHFSQARGRKVPCPSGEPSPGHHACLWGFSGGVPFEIGSYARETSGRFFDFLVLKTW